MSGHLHPTQRARSLFLGLPLAWAQVAHAFTCSEGQAHPCGGGSSSSTGSSTSAFDRARKLTPPVVEKTKYGEFEGSEFWEEHEKLLEQAWQEAPRKHDQLYAFDSAFEERYLTEELRNATAAARSGAGEDAVRGLFSEVAPGTPGIWASEKLFTDAFLEDMLEELDHIGKLGIPMRRPNGMNRYGAILSDVGFDAMFGALVNIYIRPIVQMLFPDVVGPDDAEENYVFSVRYAEGEDVELSKHRDASVATLNLCLGRVWSGGDLRFFGDGEKIGYGLANWIPASQKREAERRELTFEDEVVFRPGMAVLHRGQHQHQALQLLGGERTNLIVWLFARYGVVRVAPYMPNEQITAAQRWS